MEAPDLKANLEAEYETELSRLGSSKALYAVTNGEMEAAAVLSALAGRALAAAETFDAWTTGESDDDAADVFEAVAEAERAHAQRLADAGEIDAAPTPTPVEDYLQTLDSTPERAAGLVTWAMLTDRTLSQAVGFFVGSANRQAADLIRELREETDEQLDRALDLLDTVIATDPPAAETAANRTVETAYDHYVDVLDGMGIKVKPVC